MGYAIQWLRSLIFIGQMYVMLLVISVSYAPLAMFSSKWTFRAVHAYAGWVRWTAGWMVGLRSEIRGTPPTSEVMVASKHQSFFDILMISGAVPQPKFIMKASLKWAPFLGWYAQRMGCVMVDRGKRGAAITQMKAGVAKGAGQGQLIIYPQGTRVAPGVQKKYKVGSGVLYEQLASECVPAATNVGVFWPRHGIYRKPGLAVIEFLPPIPPGLPVGEFMKKLEDQIETASDILMAEAGFVQNNSAKTE